MSILEIVLLIAFALILGGVIVHTIYRKKHPKKKEDEDGEDA